MSADSTAAALAIPVAKPRRDRWRSLRILARNPQGILGLVLVTIVVVGFVGQLILFPIAAVLRRQQRQRHGVTESQ